MSDHEEPIDLSAALPTSPPSEEQRASKKDDGPKLAERIVRLVASDVELFHDEKGTAFAAIRTEAARLAVHRLDSTTMRGWIARTVRQLEGTTVSRAALDEALTTLDGIARFDRNTRRIHLRVAEDDDGLLIDLGDETGAYVHVTASGWVVSDGAPPVMFSRTDALRPLPRPVKGGSVDDLRQFVNVADDDTLHLLLSWLVAAFRPGRPVPILAFHGEQGTAKSTASRIVRALVDPNASPIRCAPRKEDDLVVAAQHSFLLAFDNLSGIPEWLSDALCRLATGGGLSKRKLFTDGDEMVFDAMRAIVVNGIDDLATRADFAERCLVLTLQPIARGKRRDEASLWHAFKQQYPLILGVLLDGVASALRNVDSIELADPPRMADFARWIAGSEPGLKLPVGTLRAAYERNRAAVVDLALESSPVAASVRRLLDLPKYGGRWRGEPTQLLTELTELVSESFRRHPSWPKTPNVLSKLLRRSSTFLRNVGVEIDLDGYDGRGVEKRRLWTLARTTDAPSEPGSSANADVGAPGDRVDDGDAALTPSERTRAATADTDALLSDEELSSQSTERRSP